MRATLPLLISLLCLGCPETQTEFPDTTSNPTSTAPTAQPTTTGDATAKPPEKTGYARLDRATFNKMAMRLNEPVYWTIDANKDGVVDPPEVAALLFFPTKGQWVSGGKFTDSFAKTYDKLVEASKAAEPADARQKKLIGELDSAASVLVRTEVSKLTADDKKLVDHMMKASKLIDDLYAKQNGLPKIASKVAPDAASQSVYRRNWTPACKTPKWEKDKGCTAAPGVNEVPVDVYPEALQKDPEFCKKLENEKNKKELMTPFSVVREKDGKLFAEGYEKAYGPEMKAIADELRAAAKDVTDKAEAPLVAYLNAAAKAFETNKWEPADEAWAKMNARNSKWYLRVAPDETYWEPCSLKAGFHLTFARIDTSSLALQEKLQPVKQQMEEDLAKLIGAPYKARKIDFHLPDFIQIAINAGDDRDPIGATIGQSLPNWGAVANQNRGRTVVMTNLYQDPDSKTVLRAKASLLLSATAMKDYTDDGGPSGLGTVLHEATHNLGPSHEYKVDGKKDDESFGGDLASMMEELKAQSGAYFYLYLLQDKGLLKDEDVRHTIVDNVVWGMGHISRGMVTASGQRKPYSQLAAVQLGFFIDEGAVTWDPNAAPASGGTDKGAFSIDFTKFKAAAIKLMKTVGTLKAKGDKPGALALADKYVDTNKSVVPHALITERLLRFPQPNFVYSFDE